MNGFSFFSIPNTVGFPCPGKTWNLSGKRYNFSIILFIIWSKLPNNNSVLPIEPWNKVSPVNSSFCDLFSTFRVVLPGVCPGVSIIVNFSSSELELFARFPSGKASPS